MRGESVTGVQPAIFRWARITTGLSIDDVATMLERQADEIEAWEHGTAAPTYALLEKLAYKVYKRPLAIFFLPNPPEEVLPQKEFRTLPDADMQSLSRDTYLHIRKARAYQLELQDLFDSHNPTDRCIWKFISLSPQQDISGQAQNIREFLGITLEKQIAWKSDDQALKTWRQAIEDVGIFVFKDSFKQKEISGFCLADKNLPIIYLNNSTTKTRQIFSLLHELAHLLLSINGLSKFNSSYIDNLPQKEAKTERFCNAIAADILIPQTDFSIQANQFSHDIEKSSELLFSSLAKRYGVSREAILRRFLDNGRISVAFYEEKAKFWINQKQQRDKDGGNPYLTRNAYLSDRFKKEVIRRHYQHQITLEQASDYFGIKAKNFSKFEACILEGAVS
jgi:Zn-dependent peptidase ImmA (M78 family)/transcriptional regulator with XRE-family HTH domain